MYLIDAVYAVAHPVARGTAGKVDQRFREPDPSHNQNLWSSSKFRH
jgi:hypothetical protein